MRKSERMKNLKKSLMQTSMWSVLIIFLILLFVGLENVSCGSRDSITWLITTVDSTGDVGE